MNAVRSGDRLMTEGAPWRCLLSFAVPLLVGNLFQQLYSTVDSAVVGRFVGREALAAVGSVEPIINTFIGTFMGMGMGSSVVISQHYGARDDAMVGRASRATIVLAALISIFCTVVSILSLPHMLRLMAVPDDVYDEAYSYLLIYFAGFAGLIFYNMASGILRAVGDSRRPLVFLLFSTTLNIALDLLFVARLGLGIEGAACATIIAQAASAALVLVVLTRERGAYGIRWREIRLDPFMLRRITRIGLPGALQMMVTQISNVFVQSYINAYGSIAMAGWSSFNKIEKACFLPLMSVGLAVSTFVGQNLGAGDAPRARRGTTSALWICFIVAAATALPCTAAAPILVSLFTSDPEVIELGVFFMRMQMPFLLVVSVNQVYASALRGSGDTKTPVVLMMFSFVLFRQIYLYTVTRFTSSLVPIALGYPSGWVVCSILMFACYKVRGFREFTLDE